MQVKEYFELIVKEIHTVVAATTDEDGFPHTCAIDIMDFDEHGLYFLTARGKNFYSRLKNKEFLAFTGIKGKDTMSSAALTIRGKVRELGSGKVKELFDKNPYMYEIYPDEASQKVVSVFQIYAGSGDWFDLSQKPIVTDKFVFGKEDECLKRKTESISFKNY